MSVKKLRLFYYEEAVNAWVPAPEKIEHILGVDNFGGDETIEIEFKVVNLTDEELDNLPDAG